MWQVHVYNNMLFLLTPYVNRRPCGFSTTPAPLNKPLKEKEKIEIRN